MGAARQWRAAFAQSCPGRPSRDSRGACRHHARTPPGPVGTGMGCRPRRLVGSRDATSQREWNERLELEDVNIVSAWKLGEIEAIRVLNLSNDYFENLRDSGVTMLRPKKRLVGVNVDTERTEETSTLDGLVNEVVDESEGLDVEENLDSLEIEEMIQDDTVSERNFSCKVTVDGKEVHKVSVIRILLNEDKEQSSNDRL